MFHSRLPRRLKDKGSKMSNIEDTYSRKLLSSLLRGDVETITPKMGVNISYPQIEALMKLNRERTIELLETLWEEGYLTRSFHSTIYSCPHDGTISLRLKIVCPKCRSEDIDRVELMEHLGQGHIDIERRFRKNGKYVCPVCNKTLKTIGVDYRKLGYAYHCLSCNTLHSEPLKLLACIQSGHVFTLEEAIAKKIYSYSLNPDRINELQLIEEKSPPEDVFKRIENFILEEDSPPIELIQYIAEIYRLRSYDVKTHQVLEGASGKKHRVDIYATKPSGSTIIVGFLRNTEKATDYINNLSIVAEDIKTSRVLLIAIPTIDLSIIAYARTKGLSVIDGVDVLDVAEKLELKLDIEELVRAGGSLDPP